MCSMLSVVQALQFREGHCSAPPKSNRFLISHVSHGEFHLIWRISPIFPKSPCNLPQKVGPRMFGCSVRLHIERADQRETPVVRAIMCWIRPSEL